MADAAGRKPCELLYSTVEQGRHCRKWLGLDRSQPVWRLSATCPGSWSGRLATVQCYRASLWQCAAAPRLAPASIELITRVFGEFPVVVALCALPRAFPIQPARPSAMIGYYCVEALRQIPASLSWRLRP